MTQSNDYCQNPDRCKVGLSLNHIAESLNKSHELFAKRLEKLEENIIVMREEISALRLYQEAVTDLKQAVAKLHERIDNIPKLIDDEIKGLNIDARLKDIHEKVESKISYKQVTFIITVISILFTGLNFITNHFVK